jgi:hypothetical protein
MHRVGALEEFEKRQGVEFVKFGESHVESECGRSIMRSAAGGKKIVICGR